MTIGGAAPKRGPEVPPTFPGFERINRYFEMSTGQLDRADPAR